MRKACFTGGISPLEFDNMTVEQCALWLECQEEASRARFKELAILLDGQATQIISGVAGLINDKNKRITLKKLYPELFGENSKSKQTQAPQSQAAVWLNFLYG